MAFQAKAPLTEKSLKKVLPAEAKSDIFSLLELSVLYALTGAPLGAWPSGQCQNYA